MTEPRFHLQAAVETYKQLVVGIVARNISFLLYSMTCETYFASPFHTTALVNCSNVSSMAAFKKTNVKIYTKTGPDITPDTLYWKKLGVWKFLNCDLIHFDSSWY